MTKKPKTVRVWKIEKCVHGRPKEDCPEQWDRKESERQEHSGTQPLIPPGIEKVLTEMEKEPHVCPGDRIDYRYVSVPSLKWSWILGSFIAVVVVLVGLFYWINKPRSLPANPIPIAKIDREILNNWEKVSEKVRNHLPEDYYDQELRVERDGWKEKCQTAWRILHKDRTAHGAEQAFRTLDQ